MLILLPNLLASDADSTLYLPAGVERIMAEVDGLIAESEKGARSYLKRFKTKKKPHEMMVTLLKGHDKLKELDFILEPLIKGEKWGLISDAGLPCLADPGAALIRRAHQLQIKVEALSGPSSITLALMQSGLSGQRFSFHGYIAKEPDMRKKELLLWQKASSQEKSTQIFIEAPYRNAHTYLDCLQSLSPKTLLCVACNLTAEDEILLTKPIDQHSKDLAEKIAKKPTLFLFFSN